MDVMLRSVEVIIREVDEVRVKSNACDEVRKHISQLSEFHREASHHWAVISAMIEARTRRQGRKKEEQKGTSEKDKNEREVSAMKASASI
jgi:hypothetical protein